MRLNRLRLSNFRLHVDTVIDFETGLTGIIGPNGSGKTTILEAIAWALYGMPAVRGKRQDVRSLAAPGRAPVKVELDFELAGHRYRVARSLSSAELYLDGSSTPMANSTTSVTDVVRRRLGMSQQEFFNTYFTGQKELGVMAAMGPAERAQFLSRVLGYEKLRGAQVLVRERRSVLRGELSGLQSALPDSDAVARALAESDARQKQAQAAAKSALAQLKKAHAAVAEVQPRWTLAQAERDAFRQIAAELAVRESEEQGLARDLERLERELQEIAAAKQEIADIADELNVHQGLAAQLLEMERLFQEEGRRKELQRNCTSLEQELVRLRERHAAMAAPAEQLAAAEAARDAARLELEEWAAKHEVAHTEWIRDLQEARTRREQLLSQHAETRQQRDRLVDLGPESPCPICTRPLADHFREVLDEIDGRLAEIEVNGKYFRNRVEQLEPMPPAVKEAAGRVEELQRQIDRVARAVTAAQLRVQEHAQLARQIEEKQSTLEGIKAALATIPTGYHETRHAQLLQQKAQLAPMAERRVRLDALAEREPRVKKALEKARREIGHVREALAALRERREGSTHSDKAFDAMRERFERADADLRSIQLAALAAEKELETARAARVTAEAAAQELQRAQDRLRELTLDRRVHDELDRAFSDIRGDLNQQLRPEIADLASGFLTELTDGRYTDLELDDDYNVIVKEDGIPKPVISGGEEDLANLVLRLAISQMIAERAGQSFSLLILDEVFGSLDETRRHNVIELLRRLHDRFEQVVLITHIESVREGLDRVLAVRYDPEAGVSRVERVDGGADPDGVDVDTYATAGAG